MVTSVSLTNIHHHTELQIFFPCAEKLFLKIYLFNLERKRESMCAKVGSGEGWRRGGGETPPTPRGEPDAGLDQDLSQHQELDAEAIEPLRRLMLRTFKTYCLSNFQAYTTPLVTQIPGK